MNQSHTSSQEMSCRLDKSTTKSCVKLRPMRKRTDAAALRGLETSRRWKTANSPCTSVEALFSLLSHGREVYGDETRRDTSGQLIQNRSFLPLPRAGYTCRGRGPAVIKASRLRMPWLDAVSNWGLALDDQVASTHHHQTCSINHRSDGFIPSERSCTNTSDNFQARIGSYILMKTQRNVM